MRPLLVAICISSALAFCPQLWFSTPAFAADTLFKPYISISEEFNDNIFETATNRRNEFTTRVQPGFTYHYLSPFWTWDAAYNFDLRYYARDSKSTEYNHNAMLKGNIAILENFLFLDLSDTYSRVSTDVARNADTQSSLFLNQTDQNIATISPYLLWRLGEKTTLKTGYRYSDTRYWGTGIEHWEQGASADLSREISSKFSLTAGYAFTHLESLPTRYDKHDVSGGFRYEYADKSFLYGQIGNSWQQFSGGNDVNYLFWNAGLTHDAGFAVATLETRVQSSTDPLSVSTRETSYTGKLDKTLQRGMVGLLASYTEYKDLTAVAGNRKRLSFNAHGNYEVFQDLTASLSATGERLSRLTVADYPYQFTGVAGLSYALKDELTLGLTYTHVNYLLDLDTTAGEKVINKVVVELKKSF